MSISYSGAMLRTLPHTLKNTQTALLRQLLRNKGGLTIGALAKHLKITRTAIRQHLVSLENVGFVTHGETLPSGGRPEQLYVLTEDGRERFPRQYSWLAELLLELLQDKEGAGNLENKLEKMGRQVGSKLKAQIPGKAGSVQQISALALGMNGLGYEATARTENGDTFIDAYNCVFHKLAEKNQAVCKFDLALLSESTGCKVEHRSCMVRGGGSCQFHFRRKKAAIAGK
jgi:predicted ArsR family transcriptional regulator